MRRLLALLLLAALIATPSLAPSLHTHAYSGHDHPEHHHGLAVHEHHPAAPANPDHGKAHLERCDPGQHTVSFAFVCAAPPEVHFADADLAVPPGGDPGLQSARAGGYTDVRVHGPPLSPHASPRAPPLIAHA